MLLLPFSPPRAICLLLSKWARQDCPGFHMQGVLRASVGLPRARYHCSLRCSGNPNHSSDVHGSRVFLGQDRGVLLIISVRSVCTCHVGKAREKTTTPQLWRWSRKAGHGSLSSPGAPRHHNPPPRKEPLAQLRARSPVGTRLRGTLRPRRGCCRAPQRCSFLCCPPAAAGPPGSRAPLRRGRSSPVAPGPRPSLPSRLWGSDGPGGRPTGLG